MDILRKHNTLIPCIYTELPFIRQSAIAMCVDSDEDRDILKRLKQVATGECCISVLEGPNQIIMKCVFPDDLTRKKGETGELVKFRYFYWKLWDAESLFTGKMPGEAVSLEFAKIDFAILKTFASIKSCVPLLRKVQDLYDFGHRRGYVFEQKRKQQILDVEKRLAAAIELGRMKHNLVSLGATNSGGGYTLRQLRQAWAAGRFKK